MFTNPITFFGQSPAAPPVGPVQPVGQVYGVQITGNPIPLGGYVASASAPQAGTFSRFYADVNAVSTIIVRVNGVPAHGAINVGPGQVFHDVSIAVAAGDQITFWLESGTPTSLYAFIDQGVAP